MLEAGRQSPQSIWVMGTVFGIELSALGLIPCLYITFCSLPHQIRIPTLSEGVSSPWGKPWTILKTTISGARMLTACNHVTRKLVCRSWHSKETVSTNG